MMTKMQNEYLRRIARMGGQKHITVADAKAAGYKTKKDCIADYKRYEEICKATRLRNSKAIWSRTKTHMGNAVEAYCEKKARSIVYMMPGPTHFNITAKAGDEFSLTMTYDLDWNGYSKRCRYPMKVWDIHVTIPKTGCKVRIFDGITTVYTKTRRIGAIDLYYGWMIVKAGRGSECTYRETVVAAHADRMLYAHGDDAKQAVKELKRKIELEKKRAARKLKQELKISNLTMDTVIDASDYQRITGACTPGTNAFLQEMGLTRWDKMTVREVLSITKGRFGHYALANAVK